MAGISLIDDSDAETLHRQFDPFWDERNPVEVWATGVRTARPYTLCGLALALHWFAEVGANPVFYAPSQSRHLEEMQFYSALPAGLDVRGRDNIAVEPNWKAILPIRHILTPEDVDQATEEFISNCLARTGWIRGIGTKVGEECLAEILDNAQSHGQSSLGCFTAAWIHSEKGSLNLAVVDGGIGIPSHLRRRAAYADFSDEDLLARSLEERVTGLEENHRGFGLHRMKIAARTAGRGAVALRSCSAEVKVLLQGKRDRREVRGVTRPPGTWVRIELTPR